MLFSTLVVETGLYYPIAHDTSKGFADTEQLAVSIRKVMADLKISEEYLTLRFINGSTKTADIFGEF